MENTNRSNISGDDNIVIQGLNAEGPINIIIDRGLDPELKKKKKFLSLKIEEMVNQLKELEENTKVTVSDESNDKKPNKPIYNKVDWRSLIKAIKHQGCILFIGPEISVDENGFSLHNNFYTKLVNKEKGIDFMEDEGLFSPGADRKILYDVMDFYTDVFQQQNKIGRGIIEKLVQFPFELILSLCPDDTIHHIFNDYDRHPQYLYYDGQKKEVSKPDSDNPIIFNILGSASEDGKYIYTHQNLFNYLNDITIPPVIKKTIKKATHFLFIGFDFSKWYNRLLLFVLDFEHIESDKNRLSVEKKIIAKSFEKFIERQFNITSVIDDYEEFIGCLCEKARMEGDIVKDLRQSFIQTKFNSLKELSEKVSVKEDPEILQQISKETEIIGRKIESFKKLKI